MRTVLGSAAFGFICLLSTPNSVLAQDPKSTAEAMSVNIAELEQLALAGDENAKFKLADAYRTGTGT
ncbi:MAG: hypothetical protein ACSHXD_18045, partial [Marinosulfonomonas sp.]